jgi:DNA polymerase-3 subunit delta
MVLDAFRVEQECQGRRPAPLYLFFGEEEFLMAEAVRAFEEAAGRCPFPARERYSGRELAARDLVESACTLPLGGGFRLLVVDDAQAIPAPERERLIPYCEDPCPSSCLLFVWRAKRLEADDKLAALLKRQAKVRQFGRLKGGELKAWAMSRAKGLGLKPEPAALEALIESAGGSLRDLAAEMDKAALRVPAGGRLTLEHLAALSYHGFQPAWKVAELACGEDTAAALLALAGVLAAGKGAGSVLSNIARHLRRLILAAELSGEGAGEQEIARRLGIFPYYLRGYLKQAERGRERLIGMLSEVLAADYDLKTAGVPERERLERLIFSLSAR